MSAPNAAPVAFEGVTPILRVRDGAASIGYYVHVLGFSLDWGDGGFASLSRGGCHLFLSQGDQGHPGTWVWIGVSDTDALHAELRGKGAKVRHPPTDFPWAYEMQVEDLDGNVLRLGSEPRESRPAGEWLDMEGRLWALSGSGGGHKKP